MIPNSEKKQVIGDFWHTNLLHVGMQEQTFRAWILDQTNIPILKKTQQTTNSLEWYTKHIVWFKMLFKTTCWINNQNLAAEKKNPPVMISREKLKKRKCEQQGKFKKKERIRNPKHFILWLQKTQILHKQTWKRKKRKTITVQLNEFWIAP